MDWTAAITLCIFGFISGLGIPKLSVSLIEKKLALRGIDRIVGLLDRRCFAITTAMLSGFCWGLTGLFAQNVLTAVLIAFLVTLAFLFTIIDISIHIIPNELLIVTGVVGVLLQSTVYGLKSLFVAIACMVVIFLIFLILGLIIGLHKVGAGDVKLAGIMGLVLGYPNIMYGILVMGVALLAYCIVGLSIGKLTHVSMFPFAPFLMVGMVSGLAMILCPGISVIIG